jgi:FtsH-binding integral membrane protein
MEGSASMKSWVRRIRAAIAVGLTWAAAWFAVGMILLLIVGVGAADVPFPLFFGLLGFLAGAAFSGILGLLAGRRTFEQMSLPRFALGGALGGLAIAGIVNVAAGPAPDFTMIGAVFALAGAISATGTLAIARRAEKRELLDDRAAPGSSLTP